MDPITLVLRASKTPAASAPTGGELSSAEIDANWANLRTACEQLDAASANYFGTTAPDPAEYTNWFLPTGEWFKWDGAAWFQPIAGAASTSQKKPYLWA
jgi:hypothetical protein